MQHGIKPHQCHWLDEHFCEVEVDRYYPTLSSKSFGRGGKEEGKGREGPLQEFVAPFPQLWHPGAATVWL